MPMRGSHLLKAQQKHMTPCVMHLDTTVMNREAILSIAAKFLFFPAGTPNWKHSFFIFCIDTAFRKVDTAICYAQILFKVLSKLTAKIPLFLMGGGRLGSQRIHSSASLLSTFLSQDMHSYSQHPISSSHVPILSSSVWTEKSPFLHYPLRCKSGSTPEPHVNSDTHEELTICVTPSVADCTLD